MHNQGDEHVFSVSPQAGKSTRPFVGIIVICDDRQYCIPLSSPKTKHRNMSNSIDFHRIEGADGKLIGVLDFNNMIPVRQDVIRKIDVSITDQDDQAEKYYKNLVRDQISFCRRNQDILIKKANTLYKLIMEKKAKKTLRERCLNWKKLEIILDRFPVCKQD